MKRFKNFLHKIPHFVVTLCLLSTVFTTNNLTIAKAEPNASWPESPSIYGEAAVLIEASTGTVLYDKNCYQQMYPASITKILTTMIALEEGNLSDMVEFSHFDVYSIESGAAHISRQEGELLSLKDCLYAVMLASANEVANAVGAYVARQSDEYAQKIAELNAAGESYDEGKVAVSVFADIMTERAKEVGALSSHFANPHGLFDENHYTTCYDMAMITRAAIKNDEFLKIESNTSYVIPATNKNAETHPISNRHKMLFPLNAVYYEGVLGGKTGYVDQSGSTLVTFAKRNGMTLICVVMKSNGANIYNDTRTLLDYGFNNFSLSNISETETKFTFNNNSKNSYLDTVFDSDDTLISLDETGNVILPKDVTIDQCTSTILYTEETQDNIFAHVNYYYNDICVGGTDLLLNSDDDNFSFGPSKVTEEKPVKKSDKYININIWVLLGVVLLIIIIIAVIYYSRFIQTINRSRRRRRRKRRSKYKKKNNFIKR